MGAFGLIVMVFLICWLVCGWHLVIEWFKDLYTHGWRHEMKMVCKECKAALKNAFIEEEDTE